MGMEAELILVGALIVIFIASFCGLLRKIRRTYENDRIMNERVTAVSSPQLSLTEVYVNPTYSSENCPNNQGVFPSTPPPYTELFCEPPPKYEDIVKNENLRPVPVHVSTR